MARQVIRYAAALFTLLAAVGLGAAPAWAAGSDLAARSADDTKGAVGETVAVVLGIANKGPDLIGAKSVVLSYRAPAGTTIIKPNGATNCVFNAARTTARCQLGAAWRGDIALRPLGQFSEQELQLRIAAKVTGPGAFAVTCACDAKAGNNSTNIVVNGVTKPLPSASPSKSPKPSASPSQSASPTPTPSEEPTETPGEQSEEAEPIVADSPESGAGGSSTLSGMMLIGFGVVLLGVVGLGGAVYLWRARSGDDDEGDGGVDMDATQVIR